MGRLWVRRRNGQEIEEMKRNEHEIEETKRNEPENDSF